MTRTDIYVRIWLLVGLAAGGCEPDPQRDAINTLFAEVRSVGGEARVLESGALFVDLNAGEFKISGLDLEKFTAILTAMKLSGRPCSLDLDSNPIDASKCDAIATCDALIMLDLSYCEFDTAAVARLAELKKLRTLILTSVRVPAAELTFLGNLQSLEFLILQTTDATDDTISVLTKLPRLTHLNLTKTNVTDRGISQLAKISTLKEIRISSLPITDQGLLTLGSFKHLVELDIAGSEITPQGIDDFLTKTSVDVLGVGPVSLRDPKIQELQKKYSKTRFW